MRVLLRAADVAGATVGIGVAGPMLVFTNVGFLEVDGKQVSGSAGPGEVVPPAPPEKPNAPTPSTPTPGKPVLYVSYFSSDDLRVAADAAAPVYRVACDGDGGTEKTLIRQGLLPAIRYGTAADGATVNLMNPDHPYFREAAAQAAELSSAQVAEAQAARKALTSIAGGKDPTKVWETAQCTLPPGIMAGLLHWMGAGDTEAEILRYKKFYYRTYGRQAPGGPKNYEELTDAEIAELLK